ncbi:MAG: hypothetical protein JWO06_3597 [Bacteroidota bacterium]|nr:hypothetical protein [Bacteroidota bacterium]
MKKLTLIFGTLGTLFLLTVSAQQDATPQAAKAQAHQKNIPIREIPATNKKEPKKVNMTMNIAPHKIRSLKK